MHENIKQFRENSALITEEAIQELKQPFDESKTAFYSTRDAYNADLEARRKNLAEQAEKLDSQTKILTIERDKLAAAVNDAVSRTDLELAAKLESKLDEKDAEITACKRKVKLASTAELKGDPSLFEAVNSSYNDVSNTYDSYHSAMLEIAGICEEQIKRYNTLLEAAKNAAKYNNCSYEYSAFEQVKDHFTEGPKRRAEAEAAAIAERKAAKESPARVTHVYAG